MKINYKIIFPLVLVIILILFLTINFGEFEVYKNNNITKNKDYIILYFYDIKTGCNLSGTLEIGNFSDKVINGKYILYFEEYRNIEMDEVILYGMSDYCFGIKNNNLPFYLMWEFGNISNNEEYLFETNVTLRQPSYPKSMQGFIRPYENIGVLEEMNINENSSFYDIVDKVHMDYTSDYDRFGELEYWQTPKEFQVNKDGDCEDWAIYVTSLIRQHNDTKCYFAVWETHASVICKDGNKFVILDQEKTIKYITLDKDWILQDKEVEINRRLSDYFKSYGIEVGERKIHYLINDEEIISFGENNSFRDWIIKELK